MSEGEWVDWRSPLPAESEPSAVAERAARAGESGSLGPVWGSEVWNPPGYGASGARCGEVVVGGVCVAGHVQFSEKGCGRRSCPSCWGGWARDAAARATVRAQAFRLTQPPDARRQAAHAVVSPPEGTVRNDREYWDGYGRAADVAAEKGFRGFSVMGHPWRPTNEAKRRYRAADPDVGIWVWLRDLPDGEFRELIRWSPHYHVIGVTSPDMEPGTEADEWTYSFLRSFGPLEGPGDQDGHRDVYGAYRYLLSHVGFPEESGKQVTRWYGEMANSVFVDEATEEWQNQKPAPEVMARLEREVAAVSGGEVERRDGSDRGEERCSCEECDAVVVDVFDLDAYLRQQEPPEEVAAVMRAARDWRLHRLEPPPGLKRPRTEAEAREAFEAILG